MIALSFALYHVSGALMYESQAKSSIDESLFLLIFSWLNPECSFFDHQAPSYVPLALWPLGQRASKAVDGAGRY